MEYMYAQTRPLFTYSQSHLKDFGGGGGGGGGNGVRTHVNSKKKSPLPETNFLRGGSNP